MKLAIVDYNAGNLTSVRLALKTIGRDGIVSSDPDIVAKADRIIFPGVGAAGAAMENLRRFGLDEALRNAVQRGVPLLGICVGMQILFDFSEEDGGTKLLGLIPGRVIRFSPENRWDKVPQIGWNNVTWPDEQSEFPLFRGIENGSDFYFVHGFYPIPQDDAHVLAFTGYADTMFASMIRCDNLVATQFHPEKSGQVGLHLLENFISWKIQ